MKKATINCRGNLLRIAQPIVMGILNRTPDSFYDGGKYKNEEEIIAQTEKMLNEGASIIDIGGYSSRPGAEHICEEEEEKRVIPIVNLLHQHFPKAIFSIDTFRSSIAAKAIENGASIINDIGGGELDDKMFDVVVNYHVPYVLMHMKGTPQSMKEETNYKNLIEEVMFYFAKRVNTLRKKGVKDIILDPGFGFSKNLEQNYELLQKLSDFNAFELPVMVGLSRKSMVNKVLNLKPVDALNGTTALHTLAVLNGATILRAHDVKEAMEVLKIVNIYRKV